MESASKTPTGKTRYFVVIHSNRAGRGNGSRARERIEAFFRKRALPYILTDMEGLVWDDVLQKVNEYDEVRFIAAGGDGTLRLVFQKLWEHDLLKTCPVAFLPLGSANVTALSFKLPFGLHRALNRATRGVPKAVDLGLVNNTYVFFIMVSFGTLSRVVVETKRHTKKRFGVLAYLLSFPSLFAHAYEDEKFTMSGTDMPAVETHSVVICNHLNIAGLTPARGIAPDDANLHCITLHNKNPFGLLRGAHDFYLTTKNSNILRHTRFQNERYTLTNFNGEVHIDGDTFTDLGDTVTFSVLPSAATLVI